MVEMDVASAQYRIMGKHGRSRDVKIVVGQPFTLDNSVWECRVEVRALGHNWFENTMGVDSAQALSMALERVRFVGYWLRTRFGDRLRIGNETYNEYLRLDPTLRIQELIARGKSNQVWELLRNSALVKDMPQNSI